MSTSSSSSQEEIRRKADQESRKTDLMKEISQIGKILSSVKSPDPSPLVSELDDKKRLLLLLNPDGKEASEYALSYLQNQINEIREKADQESQKSSLFEEISKIKESLNSAKSPESPSMVRKIDAKNRTLKSVSPDGSESSFSKLSLLQNEIDELRVQADTISRKSQQESRRSALLKDIAHMKESLGPIQGTDDSPLMKKIDDKKRKLDSLILNGGEISSYELSTLQAEIDILEADVKSLVDRGGIGTIVNKVGWRRVLGWFGSIVSLPGKIPVQVWLVIIPAAATIYVAYLGYQQSNIDKSASGGAEVLLSFENTNWIPVKVIIKNVGDPEDDQGSSSTIEAGDRTAFRDLAPGTYTIEVKPVYPEMTLQASNCYVQWQQNDSYKGNLVLRSGETVIQIKHFESKPQEICFTETPMAPTPPQ